MRVVSENVSAYRSLVLEAACQQLGIKAMCTRSYRPQTNSKIERLHRTLAGDWAYTRPYTSETQRHQALPHGCTSTITTALTPPPKPTHHPPNQPPQSVQLARAPAV